MELVVYLSFDGNCEQALNFYQKCLGGKLESIFRYEGSPMAGDVPADWKNKVMHGALRSDEFVLMASDSPPSMYAVPQGFSVSLHLKDIARAERIFNDLAEHGNVQMPMQETFWAARFGYLVDQFGIPWTINCEK